jgi:hypothetical protein
MELLTRKYCAYILNCWDQATVTDYTHIALGVVLVGWFIARVSSK